MNNKKELICIGIASALPATWCHATATFDCVMEPRQIVELRPAIEGVIERINVERGDLITEGQVLVVLESGVERATVELARFRAGMTGDMDAQEARLQFAALRTERRENLATERLISAQDRDDAAAEQRIAEAALLEARENQRLAELELERAVEQLKLRTIHSPFAGVVMDRLMNPGDVTDMSDSRKPVLKIADIGVLHVEVILPAAAHGLLKLGATASVTPELSNAPQLAATIKSIDRVMDAASGTFGVRLELSNRDYALPGGVRCRADFPELPESMSQGPFTSRVGP